MVTAWRACRVQITYLTLELVTKMASTVGTCYLHSSHPHGPILCSFDCSGDLFVERRPPTARRKLRVGPADISAAHALYCIVLHCSPL